MKQTVTQQMPTEQRCEELIQGLSATGEDVVFVNLSHLAQVVGLEQAESVVESLVEEREVVNPVTSPRSTLRTTKIRNAICQVSRTAALETLLRAKAGFNKAKIDGKVQG